MFGHYHAYEGNSVFNKYMDNYESYWKRIGVRNLHFNKETVLGNSDGKSYLIYSASLYEFMYSYNYVFM